MSKMIQIRHVPDELHAVLKIRAIEAGMSLSDYLLREITQISKQPPLQAVLQRIQQRNDVNIQEDSATALRAERDGR